MKDSFSIDSLIQNSWTRYKTYVVKGILTNLLSIGLTILGFIGLMIPGAILFGLGTVTKNPIFYVLLGIYGIFGLFLVLYFFSWIGLAYLRIMTQSDPKVGIWQNFVDSRKLVFQYLVFGALSGLFFFGLWYTFILIVPFILWSIWSSFSSMTFLYEDQGGLKPLWNSKRLLKGRMLAVLGRFLLIWALSIGLTALLSMVRALRPFSFIVQIALVSPFTVGYSFEIYKALKEKNASDQTEVKAGAWFYLSIIGWVLVVLLGFLSIFKTVNFLQHNSLPPVVVPSGIQKQMQGEVSI